MREPTSREKSYLKHVPQKTASLANRRLCLFRHVAFSQVSAFVERRGKTRGGRCYQGVPWGEVVESYRSGLDPRGLARKILLPSIVSVDLL
jgi:hypothetical protein